MVIKEISTRVHQVAHEVVQSSLGELVIGPQGRDANIEHPVDLKLLISRHVVILAHHKRHVEAVPCHYVRRGIAYPWGVSKKEPLSRLKYLFELPPLLKPRVMFDALAGKTMAFENRDMPGLLNISVMASLKELLCLLRIKILVLMLLVEKAQILIKRLIGDPKLAVSAIIRKTHVPLPLRLLFLLLAANQLGF